MKRHLLFSTLVVLALAMMGSRLYGDSAQPESAITIQAGETVASVNPLLFGQNFGPWMNTTGTYIAQYQAAGVTLLRFPAGNYGDENDVLPNNLDDLPMLADALDAQVEDPRPVYGVYRLYAEWGTTQVAAESSDEALLPAFASLRDDGALAIMVINKDPTHEREATLNVEGFRSSGHARVWLQDDVHLASELPAIPVAEAFPHVFPPYSATLLILEPAHRVGWPIWAGLGLLVLTSLGLIVRFTVEGRGTGPE